ncbi:hypothetical protein DFH09DRAFT_1414899 [Mycena vulgaris]|nr:hypothetical protein DFH09DRAFT_1414899 [Mycena vulgaris]
MPLSTWPLLLAAHPLQFRPGMLPQYHVYPAPKRDITAPPEHASMRRCWDFLDADQPQLCVCLFQFYLASAGSTRSKHEAAPAARFPHSHPHPRFHLHTLTLASPSRRWEGLEYPAMRPRRHPGHHRVDMADFAARASVFSSSTASDSDEKRTAAAAPGLETIAAYDLYHYVASLSNKMVSFTRDGVEDVAERKAGSEGEGASSAPAHAVRSAPPEYPAEKHTEHPTSAQADAQTTAAKVLNATLLAAPRPPPRTLRARSTTSAASRPGATSSPRDARALITNPRSVSLIFREYARAASGPIALRTRCVHVALLAVLARTHTQRFATLLYLPPTLTATSWILHGPFVPPSISGSAGLRLAAALPAPLPNAFDALMQLVPTLARATNWSGGLLSASVGLLSSAGIGDGVLDEEEREARKPPHQRGYMHRHLSGKCRVEIMRRAMAESRVAMGQKALFCLHGGDKGPLHAGDDEGAWREGEGAGHDGVPFLEEVVAGILGGSSARSRCALWDEGAECTRAVGREVGGESCTCTHLCRLILPSLQTLVRHCVADGPARMFLQHPRFTPLT